MGSVYGNNHGPGAGNCNNDEKLLVLDGADLADAYEKYVYRRILQNETLVRANESTSVYKIERRNIYAETKENYTDQKK